MASHTFMPIRKFKSKLEKETEAVTDIKSVESERAQLYVLHFLSSRNGADSAAKAGYHGDLAKRSRNLLKRPDIQAFLTKYGSEEYDYRLDVTEEAVLSRLADIASKKLDRVSTAHIIDALKLIGTHLGLWSPDQMKDGKDRLSELIKVFQAGPVKEEAKDGPHESSAEADDTARTSKK